MAFSRRKRAAALATTGGVLLLVGGASGSAGLWPALLSFAAGVLPDYSAALTLASVALLLLAALGGLTVLAGAWAMRRGFWTGGRFLVGIGTGTGFLDLAIKALVVLAEGGDPATYVATAFSGAAGLGLLIALASTLK